jgi:EsV-1-7 cysteine-rich motif
MDSKCQGCKRQLPSEAFVRGNKTYKRCETCRQKRIKNNEDRQICTVCSIRGRFNFPNQTRGIRCSKHKEAGMMDVTRKKCCHPGCTHRPSYNYKHESKGKFCAEHKEDTMVDVVSKRCAYPNCFTQPFFNLSNESKGKFCGKHKEPDMVDVRSKKCAYPNCSTKPIFNLINKSGGKFCSEHKEDGMIDVVSKKCAHPDCFVKPHFNWENESKGKFCGKHREHGMINVVSKKCAHIGCKFLPTFIDDESGNKFCVQHKKDGMVSKHEKCNHPGCAHRPSYNYKHESKGKFCVEHKEDEMVDVISKKCAYLQCSVQPIFNWKTESKGKFCSKHKEDGMVDVRSKKCAYPDCQSTPNFNLKTESIGKFCAEHKEPNMIDVKHKKCDDCNTRASYGLPGSRASACAKHKVEGMCRYPTSRCQTEDCKEKATYGIDRPLHCEEHHQDQEQNLCLRKCKNCSHLEICNNEGLCFEYCVNSDLFKRSKHQKEIRVQNLLKREIQEQPYSCDKIVDSSCNKKRPDILYDCKTHFLAIEIDEHQHSSYQAECETTRMKEICQAIGMPTIFIRYNPDNYTDSQFKKSKIPKAKREQILVEWVRHCINSSPESDDQFLRVIYLFYDGFEPTKSSLDIIKMI